MTDDDLVERLRDEVKGRVPVWRDRLEAADEIERLRKRQEQLVEAIAEHFASLHSIVPWCAIVLNDDGDLQAVDEIYDDDDIVVDDRVLAEFDTDDRKERCDD